MKPKMFNTPCTLLTALAVAGPAAAQTTVDFEDLPLAPNAFVNGGPVTNTDGFVSHGVAFGNSYNSSFGGFWNGFSYSSVNDTATAGIGNQYAAFTGTGFGGSGNYAVGFAGSNAFINLAAGQSFGSVRATNTTYAALSMAQGDSFAKKFGGATGDDPDFFKVTFTGFDGLDAAGAVTGSVDFFLADYRFSDNTQDFIADTWGLVDLSGLGNARSLGLSFDSSDVGAFGVNTPTYVALDNLVVVPEPASAALLALAGLGLLRRRA